MIKITDNKSRKCDSCGGKLQEGELFYHCRTEIMAIKDPSLLELKYTDRLIAQALRELEGKDAIATLDNIYHEIILQLCPACHPLLLQKIDSMSSNRRCCGQCQPLPKMPKKGKLLSFSATTRPDKDSL